MKLTPLLLALLVAATASLQGCVTPTRTFVVEKQVAASSENTLWETLLLSIKRSGYGYGIGADSGKREVVSNWKNDLAPYKGKGFRTRVIANYEPAENAGEGLLGYDVTIRVEKQTNESYRSLDLTYAKWEPADDDAATARLVMQNLQALLGTLEL